MTNRIDLYNKTVDILFNAYFNDTLRHGDCTACAVGNIILGNGVPRCRGNNNCWNNGFNNASWKRIFSTYIHQRIDESVLIPESQWYSSGMIKAIEQTGYHWRDLAKVEFAFETAELGLSDEDHMFNGLVAVLNILKEIHEIDDNEPEVTRFKNHYATLV